MRLSYTVLITVAGLVASVDALSASTQSKMANPAFPGDHALFRDDQTDGGTKRSLRAEKSIEEERDGKARVLIVNVFSKLKDVFRLGKVPKIPKEVTPRNVTPRNKLERVALEKQQKCLEDSFIELKLDQAGSELFKSPDMVKWVNLRKKYNEQHGIEDTSEFSIVAKYFTNEEELARMVENARRNKSTETMAKQFQAGQLGKWLRDGKDPNRVYDLLFVKNEGRTNMGRWQLYREQYNIIYRRSIV